MDAETRVGLIVSNHGALPSAESFDEFQAETERILKAPGIRLEWRLAESLDNHESFDRLAVLRISGVCSLGAADRRVAGQTLGFTHVSDGRILPFVELHCSRVLAMIEPRLRKQAPRIDAGIFGRALARVAAHELYHVLANTAAHDKEGLAKEALSSNDLFGFDVSLSARSLEAIASNLKARPSQTAFSAAARAR